MKFKEGEINIYLFLIIFIFGVTIGIDISILDYRSGWNDGIRFIYNNYIVLNENNINQYECIDFNKILNNSNYSYEEYYNKTFIHKSINMVKT